MERGDEQFLDQGAHGTCLRGWSRQDDNSRDFDLSCRGTEERIGNSGPDGNTRRGRRGEDRGSWVHGAGRGGSEEKDDLAETTSKVGEVALPVGLHVAMIQRRQESGHGVVMEDALGVKVECAGKEGVRIFVVRRQME